MHTNTIERCVTKTINEINAIFLFTISMFVVKSTFVIKYLTIESYGNEIYDRPLNLEKENRVIICYQQLIMILIIFGSY